MDAKNLFLRKKVSSDSTLLNDLISWHDFDETTGTTAIDSHGSHDGIGTGVTINQTGKIDKCWDLSQGDKVIFDAYNDLFDDVNDTMFFSAWVNMDSVDDERILAKYDYNAAFYNSLIFGISTGRLRITAYFNGTGDYFHFMSNSALVTTSAGWQHVMGYIEITSTTTANYGMWVDNTFSTATPTFLGTQKAALQSNVTTLKIAEISTGTPTIYFDGKIDSVAIWNRILTSDERDELWNSGDGIGYSSL